MFCIKVNILVTSSSKSRSYFVFEVCNLGEIYTAMTLRTPLIVLPLPLVTTRCMSCSKADFCLLISMNDYEPFYGEENVHIAV